MFGMDSAHQSLPMCKIYKISLLWPFFKFDQNSNPHFFNLKLNFGMSKVKVTNKGCIVQYCHMFSRLVGWLY